METFPTLSQNPSVDGWEEEIPDDPTLRSKSEGGYEKTRPRHTRIPEGWKVVYEYLPVADKALIKNLERTLLVGADAFNWTNPVDETTHTVRFAEPVKYVPQGSKLFWKIEFTLKEV